MGKKKVFPFMGSWYSKRPAWAHGFNAEIGFENMHRVLSYWSKCPKFSRSGLASPISTRFDQYLGIRYFPKPISALKPWAQAGCFEYHEPYKWKNFFLTYKGVLSNFQRICGGSKTFRNQKILFSPYLLYPRATFPSWPKRSGEKSIFQPPLLYMCWPQSNSETC